MRIVKNEDFFINESEDNDNTIELTGTYSEEKQINVKSQKNSVNKVLKLSKRRRSPSIIQHLEPDTAETRIDQVLTPNVNANWVNFKGAWIIHILIIMFLKIIFNFITILNGSWKWTLTNLTYNFASFIMFHQIKGTPFEFNSGAYDNLTMWEQIDNGDQYTPTKKFLMSVPIGLFLISTHYSDFNLNLFVLNGLSCLCVIIPKLEVSHRLRISLY